MNKTQIRACALQQRQSLATEQRNRFSQSIISSLFDHLSAQSKRPDNLLIYRSLPSEVDTGALLEVDDYRLFAPVTHHYQHMEWHGLSRNTCWETGLFGIQEPDSGDLWDGQEGLTTLLCPLTAFDRQGNRLGMGKGCFDVWLSQHHEQIQQVIGLAFSCQEVRQIPFESHDMPMDYVITEKEVVACMKAV